MTYRDLFVQGKTEIYAAWNDLEDALRMACEHEERGELVGQRRMLEWAAGYAYTLGAAATVAVKRMRAKDQDAANPAPSRKTGRRAGRAADMP